jgi:hypothetical protein
VSIHPQGGWPQEAPSKGAHSIRSLMGIITWILFNWIPASAGMKNLVHPIVIPAKAGIQEKGAFFNDPGSVEPIRVLHQRWRV